MLGKKKTVFIRTSTIYDMYEQRVGKNVIEAVTSFCIEAKEEDGKYVIDSKKEERLKQREIHLKRLNYFDSNDRVLAFRPWNRCIASIAPACYKNESADSYTKQRACEVTNYLQAMKKSLESVERIKKAMKELTANTYYQTDMKIYSGDKRQNQKDVNEITTVTSREIAESSYNEKVKDIQEIYQKCLDENDTESEDCKKFVVDETIS